MESEIVEWNKFEKAFGKMLLYHGAANLGFYLSNSGRKVCPIL
jgi:hypothetical protein